MKRVLLAVVVFVGALGGAAAPAANPGTVQALVWKGNTLSLASLDPLTLAPRRRLLPLGRAHGSVHTDPSGDRLAVASAGVGVVVVDTRRMRVLWRLPQRGRHVHGVSWLSPNRLLVAEHGGVLLVDTARGRIVAEERFEGNVIQSTRWRDGLVLLAERGAGRIEPARLVVVGPAARIRTVELARIPSGTDGGENNQGPYRTARPGLTVDRAASAAFVAGGLVVARVDLATLAATYSGTERTVQKLAAGPRRSAAWLGGGTLAVAGSDESVTGADGRSLTSTPYGLRYIRADNVTIVNDKVTEVSVANGRALAYGVRYVGGRFEGVGLTAYDRAGAVRWHLFEETPVSAVQIAKGVAYVWMGRAVTIVEVATGSILGTATRPAGTFFQVVG